MSTLIALIKALLPSFKSQKDLDEAYLAESVNTFDLERRMREIDTTARGNIRRMAVSNMMS